MEDSLLFDAVEEKNVYEVERLLLEGSPQQLEWRDLVLNSSILQSLNEQ